MTLLFAFLVSTASWATATQAQDARLKVVVLDESGEETPARIRLTDRQGRVAPLPPEAVAVMYGHWDHADGYGYQPDSSFYTAGSFSLSLPAGPYHLDVQKGHEYVAQRDTLLLSDADVREHVVRLERWIDMPARGWYSGDDHIHVRRSPREDSLLLTWTRAEDVHVGVMLRMGDFWEIYYAQYAWGKDGVYQRDDYFLTSGQEDPRTPELGHALGMGMSDRVRNRERYYLYDEVFDRIRELGGVAGYAHHADTFHGYRGLVLDGLRGKVDVLELLQFCTADGPLIVDHYYHMLDLGFEVTAVAGSDFPWCGMDHRYGEPVDFERAARIGNARFYALIEGALSYEPWKEAVRAGRTFVSSGPMLDLHVNGQPPGSRLNVAPGDTVEIEVEALGHATQIPLAKLEIVGHGAILAQANASDAGQSNERLRLTLALPVQQGIWIAARAFAGRYQAAHTTPVYVRVDEHGFVNARTLSDYIARSEAYLSEIETAIREETRDPERQAWKYRAELEARIAETRAALDALRARVPRSSNN